MKIPNSKLLILARHPESVKNLETHFSATTGHEVLTERGNCEAEAFAAHLRQILTAAAISPDCCCIASSSSVRTMRMAMLAATAIGSDSRVDSGLDAISAGNLAGLKESEAKKIAPRFVEDLELYRAGVCNSYRLAGYGEDVKQFESRVKRSLDTLLGTDFEAIVVVAHRSSITAALILLARVSLDYPESFYGYIPLDLGHLSAVFVELGDVAWVGVNLSPDELHHRLLSYPQ